jgi:copper chaperone
MSTAVLKVPHISCGHCENTISKALGAQAGVRSIRIDVPSRQVFLDYEEAQLSLERVKKILEEEEYPVESVATP